MEDGSRILCVGATHWDSVGRAGSQLRIGDDIPGVIERRPGGVATNIATGLAAQAVPVSLCSVVGDDPAGRDLIQTLEARGIDCNDVLRIEGASTGQYIAIENDRGDLFAAIADGAVLDENQHRIVSRCEVIIQHAETVVLDANLGIPALQTISDAARQHQVKIVINPVSPVKATRLEFLLSDEYTPTIVANRAEVTAMLGATFQNVRDAAAALQVRSKGTALVTDGANAIALATSEDTIVAIPPVVSEDISVTGAGDALLAAYLASAIHGAPPETALRTALEAAVNHMKSSTSR